MIKISEEDQNYTFFWLSIFDIQYFNKLFNLEKNTAFDLKLESWFRGVAMFEAKGKKIIEIYTFLVRESSIYIVSKKSKM